MITGVEYFLILLELISFRRSVEFDGEIYAKGRILTFGPKTRSLVSLRMNIISI